MVGREVSAATTMHQSLFDLYQYRLVDEGVQGELPTPYCTLADHTLPITDIVCGAGVFPSCRILTSSVDHSAKVCRLGFFPYDSLEPHDCGVKVWDLSSKTLLTTVQFPQPITSLAWDVTERLFFAASENGSVYQVNLFRQRPDLSNRGLDSYEAVGGLGQGDSIRVDENQDDTKKRLINVR